MRYDPLLLDGFCRNLHAEPTGGKGRAEQSAAYNLLKRLRTYKHDVLRLLDRFDVPFDNNQSERDLRMMKVKKKVSGGFRSEACALIICRLRGYIATLRKQGSPLLPALQSVFEGQPLMPRLSG